MASKHNVTQKLSLALGVSVALALAVWWSIEAQASDEPPDRHEAQRVTHLKHITTLAEAEALQQGDILAVVCSMCRFVEIHHVTNDKLHVKLMTVGEKHTCAVCGGIVTLVGTGKGNGKNEEVNHVCSKCGDDAMFVCATKAGGGEHQHDARGK
ncbi:MAG TPA: hypothetical protein PKN33_08800 [Phycisphaerae bacterium]|nr:hypothetical protein [Phycisphaerae bacterium]